LAPPQTTNYFLFNLLKCGLGIASMERVSSINGVSGSYIQSILSNILSGTGSASKTSQNSLSGLSATSLQKQDDSQLSPFALLVSKLQELQKSDRAKYKEITAEIATKLKAAADTATADGNTTAAAQLNKLASDFTDASSSGQLPNLKDLAQAIGGGHHGHHRHAVDSDASTTTSNSAASASQALSQLLASLQPTGTQNSALDPMSIIMKSLSDAGINLTSN
jgi:hypothetical protein